jgi:hypothetical protein
MSEASDERRGPHALRRPVPLGAVRRPRRPRPGRARYFPFGADIHAERSFDGIAAPSRLTAGWSHGTPQWAPFFEAEVTTHAPPYRNPGESRHDPSAQSEHALIALNTVAGVASLAGAWYAGRSKFRWIS